MKLDQRSSEEFVTRVLDAQASGYCHGEPLSVALEELRQGEKHNDWIWYVFPQVAGLGNSRISQYFWVRHCSDMASMLSNATLLENFTLAYSITAEKLAVSPTSRLRDVFKGDDKKVSSSSALFAGFLDRHPHVGVTTLHESARYLLGIASREGLVCPKTEAFIAGC